MNLGDVDKIIVMGGGQSLLEFVILSKRLGIQLLVVTSQRQSSEVIFSDSGEKEFIDALSAEKCKVYVSDNINKDEKVLSEITNTTLGFSIAGAWIFRYNFISAFDGKLLNIHGSNLPQNRGCGGYSWRILRNDRSGGFSIHIVDEGMDTGEIIMYKNFTFDSDCRKPVDYYSVAKIHIKELFKDFLDKIKKGGDFELMPQPEHLSTYWPRISSELHSYIDWSYDLIDLERFICAFDDPYDGAQTFINNKMVHVKDCIASLSEGSFHPFQTGIVYRKSKDHLFIAAKQGTLIIRRVITDNGEDLMKNINVGDRFHTPQSLLENSMSKRAIFTPKGLKQDS